jgi:hypothetical protein
MQVLGADLAVYAYPAGVDLGSRSEVERLADGLERSAHVLRQVDVTLAYHNHAMEFFRLDGELVIARIQGDHIFHLGEQVVAHFDLDRVTLFDPKAENVLK